MAHWMMLRIGVTPMPPARNTAAFETSLCSVNEPIAWLTFTCVPSGSTFRHFLNAVGRMRVATVIVPFSLGLVQKENVRAFPSASVSDGLSRIKSAFCPGLKVKSVPLESNQNAMVPSATSRRSFKGNRCSTIGVLPDDPEIKPLSVPAKRYALGCQLDAGPRGEERPGREPGRQFMNFRAGPRVGSKGERSEEHTS